VEENPTVRIPDVSVAPAVKANGNVPSWDISQHLRLPPVVRVPEFSAVQQENALVGENENKTRAAASPPAAVLEIRHFSRRDTAVSLAVSGLFGGLCHILSLPIHVDQHLHAYRHCAYVDGCNVPARTSALPFVNVSTNRATGRVSAHRSGMPSTLKALAVSNFPG